ncbi:NADPH:quinone reductase [Niabella ginsenosidivorans]|uniref:NADPH:quinone reductase n=1 Tax=Niabella ginsenosidivorans TaxID=1176587 RepID=A0A1A9I1K1_9BACT|nr:NADP-dependent oxidoreductase [Niabella ginsenosidivorans]ANH80572.1 NADPH:quinone reductase [Niabella ginsenosidivorans]
MKAVVLEKFGSINNLTYKEVPAPVPPPGTVLIKTAYAAVNPYDRKIIEIFGNEMGVKVPVIPGSELSGTVTAVGEGVTQLKEGDAVFGTLSTFGGCFAELVVAKATDLVKKPEALSFETAAATPVAALTARKVLFETAHLQSGQKVLIHGASGNVGAMAVQLAKLAGAYVIATGSGKNESRIKKLGADEFIDYTRQDFSVIVKDVDVVLDTIGGKTQEASFKVIKQGGWLVSIVQPPSEAEASRYQVHATIIYSGPDTEQLSNIARQIVNGDLKVNVEKVYPLNEAIKAVNAVKEGHRTGKILLKP